MAPDQTPLFDPADFPPAPPDERRITPVPYPLWTEHKATLIFRYLYYFVMVTKHGTYIDGFAGPQNDEPGMWAAKLVIESQPPRLRHFHFVELDKEKIPELEALQANEKAAGIRPRRTVDVYHGDFNVVVDEILRQGTITPKEATFCLLDQRTFECHWATVEKLARHKPAGELKIELFYFLPIGWLDRAFAATRDTTNIRAWWGRDDWQTFVDLKKPHARAEAFRQRLRQELGYQWVDAWPIYQQQGGGPIMYYMIHASDHPEAPKLMRRAYVRAVDPLEPPEQLALELGVEP